tara:strand:- start:136 stop:879 length:744 start_codon:yes stop_codon:yes gene_type:complete
MANDPNLKSLFENLNMISSDQVTQQRPGGGTGGGSQILEGNMDPNPLIGLNPYLSENVTSFNHGGNVGGSVSMDMDNERPAGLHGGNSGRGPYVPHQPGSSAYKAYVDQGVIPQGNTTFNPYTGRYTRQVKQRHNEGGLVQYNKGGAMHQMPDGSMMAGATHPKAYNQGGSYLQQANQSIQASQQANEQQALGQLSGLVAKSLQQKMSPEQATSMASQMAEQSGLVNQPMANRGMRMRKRYTQGGRF